MKELERIEYAKSFIDKLASGMNPLDDTPISDDNILSDIRISKCFLYVSGILQKEMVREERKQAKAQRSSMRPFFVGQEQLERFEYSSTPISAAEIGRRINWLVRENIELMNMQKFSYRKINYWLRSVGMIEWKPWNNGKSKRFPTAKGEEMGLIVETLGKNGKIRSPIIYFSEEAQHFIIENIEAVMAAEKGSFFPYEYEDDEDEKIN